MKTLAIGRDAANQIVLDHNFVSRFHAQLIIMDNGKVMLKDLDSTNGTFVNGNKITEAYLQTGDIVKCGGAFLNWADYLSGDAVPSPPSSNKPYQRERESTVIDSQAYEPSAPQKFSLGTTLKYITTKIFDTGDLFKTEWNRIPPTLFFILLPAPFILTFLLYAYGKLEYDFTNQVVLPFITSLLVFGVSQFLTFGLLSMNRNAHFPKILFASSIFSFFQAIPILLYLIVIIFFTNSMDTFNHMHFDVFGKTDLGAGYFVISILLLFFFIMVLVSSIIYLYKYFRAIGVSSGVSLQFVILTFALNTLIQASFIYLLSVIMRNNAHFL
jgi:hypothetical protein